MIKILAFLEADLPRIESELNSYMDRYDIIHVHSTGSRLIFILQEKTKRDPISHRRVASQKES